MTLSKPTLAVIVAVAAAIIIVSATILYFHVTVTSRGTIKVVGIEVYEDEALTTPLTEINWGVLAPSDIAYKDFWAFNNGTTPVTLNYTTDKWMPPLAETYLDLSWNYLNQTIEPSQSLALTFTMTVASDITDVTVFSHDIVIIGQG